MSDDKCWQCGVTVTDFGHECKASSSNNEPAPNCSICDGEGFYDKPLPNSQVDFGASCECTKNGSGNSDKFKALYITVNEMMAVIGAHGQIISKDDRVSAVMDALHEFDDGVYDVNRLDGQGNSELLDLRERYQLVCAQHIREMEAHEALLVRIRNDLRERGEDGVVNIGSTIWMDIHEMIER